MGVEQLDCSYAAVGNVKNERLIKPPWKTAWWFLMKLNVSLIYDPATPFLDIFQVKRKHITTRNLYKNVHSSFIHKCQRTEKNINMYLTGK